MQYRPIHQQSASLLGYGCMRFPKLSNGALDREAAFALLDAAYQGGVTYYDTAYTYHNQDSEPMLGGWMKTKPRDSLLVATKLPVWLVQDADHALELFEEQLNRLQTDYIDYYLFHALDAKRWKKMCDMGIPERFWKLKEQGKIRQLGFSFHDEYPVFEQILTDQPWDFCQIQLNYMDTEIQAGLRGAALADQLGIPVVVMEPVKGGGLANPPNDICARFAALHPDWSGADWAMHWVAGISGVSVILSGMGDSQQLTDNLQTLSTAEALGPDELEAIDFARLCYLTRAKIPCTACAYCMPCPAGVDIPSIFNIYNRAFIYEIPQSSRSSYEIMDATEKADVCIGCGKCEQQCPQSIGIRFELAQAHAFLTSC